MEIEVEINKTYAMIVLGIIFLLAGGLVYAYGTSSPSNFGHSAGELDLSGSIQTIHKGPVGDQEPSQTICCDAGWVRTGCGESGSQESYSYPTSGECCKAKFLGNGHVYAICSRLT
jgi:hypothetical protein